MTVVRYAPQAVRKSVTGYGWSTKRETAELVVSHFPALRVYLTQDRRWKEAFWLNLFDAVALALHHQDRAATTALPSRRGAVEERLVLSSAAGPTCREQARPSGDRSGRAPTSVLQSDSNPT